MELLRGVHPNSFRRFQACATMSLISIFGADFDIIGVGSILYQMKSSDILFEFSILVIDIILLIAVKGADV